jgi:hypothetical protein
MKINYFGFYYFCGFLTQFPTIISKTSTLYNSTKALSQEDSTHFPTIILKTSTLYNSAKTLSQEDSKFTKFVLHGAKKKLISLLQML